MKKGIGTFFRTGAGTILILLSLVTPTHWASAASASARVTQIIQDVKLLPSNAAPRPAAVNDDVNEGTAVRTGADSRTELTFTDRTLTRLGSNSVFSFNTTTRTFDLGQGAVLMQVPPNGSTVKVKTAAVTAAITGGTALFGNGPPTKFMVLEGTGTFYPNGHPEEAITLHGGEMVTFTPDGHIIGPTTFDVKTVLETSELIVDFPDLANLPLILTVVGEQQGLALGEPTPMPKDPNDTVDQANNANNASPGSSPPDTGKFGSPSTISSPNPYQITSGTSIQTDPTITTNGVTDQGKIYQGQAVDGPFSTYAFGSTTIFDTTSGIDSQTSNSGAVFKFQSLQLTGNPTVTTTNGETSLALIGVDGITSGGPGGTVTFAGITGLLFATQNGSINLGSEISFSGSGDLNFYARGSGSNLTLGSGISGYDNLRLYSEGTVQLNGGISVTNFSSFSGGDFLTPTASIFADNIDIQSLSNISIDASLFPEPLTTGGTFSLNAANTLNITNIGGGTFGWNSFSAIGTTINLSTSDGNATIDFSNSNGGVTITGGSGGINGSEVGLKGAGMHISTTNGGDISLYSVDVANSTLSGFVHAASSFTAQQDVATDSLTAGTFINIGGNVIAGDITAGTTIDIGGRLAAFGTVAAGGDITAYTVAPHNIDAPNGVLTAGDGGIHPFVVIFGPGDGPDYQQTYNVKSIVSPEGIDFSGNQYHPAVNNPGPGGKLTINATTIDFNSATGISFANFNGADAGGIANEPAAVPENGGDGGTFIVNATGNITTVLGADITATTGLNASGDLGFSGNGGSVTLNSSGGTVTVDSLIQVSSNDFISEESEPIRRSASGGNITLHSGLTTGLGVSIGGNAQLLSLLNMNAPGPGGTISITTAGADIHMGEFSGAFLVADRGTIDVHQTAPGSAGTSMIEIYNTLLSAETISIASSGDFELGIEGFVIIDGVTLSFTAAHDLTMDSLSSGATAADSSGDVTISAGNNLFVDGFVGISRFNGGRTTGLNLTLHAGADLTILDGLSLYTDATGLVSGANISVTANGNISTGDLDAYVVDGAGFATPTVDVGNVLVHADGTIDVAGRMNVLGQVTAGGAITTLTLSSTDVSSDTSIGAGSGGITRFSTFGTPAPDILHTLTAPVVTSTGGINFNGVAADGDSSIATDGGHLVINADSLSFGSGFALIRNVRPVVFGPDIVGPVTFNGGDGSSTFDPADGGTFTVNTTGTIVVDSDIEATSGHFQAPSATPAGFGGTVTLNSTGDTVTVNKRIEVSSNDPEPEQSPPPPVRVSNAGGNITITSGKANGQAINITSSAQLLSKLNDNATGEGGTIQISATGNDSTINIDNSAGLSSPDDWSIEADGGTIDINNHGNSSFITISNADMHADVIKAEIFGTGGTLTIGGGSIDASSALTLYAASSNGSIIFNADVTLNSGATAAIIAANTVTINNSVTVTIGGSIPAQVYANVRNYDVASGGTGGSFGSFAGAGATSQSFDPNNPPLVAKAGTVSSPSATSGSGALTAASQTKSGPVTVAQSSALKINLITKPVTSRAAVSPSGAHQLIASKPVLNVANSSELLAQLESATESGGKINVVAKSQPRNRLQTSTRRGNVVRNGTVTAPAVINATSTALTTKGSMAGTTPVNPVGNSVAGSIRTLSY